MNGWWQIVLLGLVQGVAEFLPISSSGHLVLVEQGLRRLMGGHDLAPGKDLEVLLHVGTLAAIVVVYRRDLWQLRYDRRLWAAVIWGTLPAAILGVTLDDWFDRLFDSLAATGVGLLITSLLLSLGHRYRHGDKALPQLHGKQALMVGLFQALALVPGISRSGSTITAGLLAGLERQAAAQFSFLLALPVTAGAIVLSLRHGLQQGLSVSGPQAALGIAVSFVVGWCSLRLLLRVILRDRLPWFAAYCALLGCLTLLWAWFVPAG
ncbi:MAG: undecaprenyl-diphosphatase [Planctomycetaceae bacterium]|nr:MAG: undecaprenyl-diphosphatase [Planctomycetaceae bacterium]